MRGQANIIGYVLLAAALLGLSFGVYFYANPLLQKSELKTQVVNIENLLDGIAKDIESVADKKTAISEYISISGISMKILPNNLIAEIQFPDIVYLEGLNQVPINTNFYLYCKDATINVGAINKTICNDASLKVTVNTTNIILYDGYTKQKLILPKKDIPNVIFGPYVFKIIDSGASVGFQYLYTLGYKGIDPACIVFLTTSSGRPQEVQYEIKCRPLYDQKTGNCEWITFEGKGQIEYNSQSEGTKLNIEYLKSVIRNIPSTVCKKVIQKEVTLSFE